ncbi:MAG: hypothetical protein IAI49_14180 [Candidatus Eremiobacteraeota bacterium]|nr:hypothetical protein [Candidatus Eremiobacteraeota bacterium]
MAMSAAVRLVLFSAFLFGVAGELAVPADAAHRGAENAGHAGPSFTFSLGRALSRGGEPLKLLTVPLRKTNPRPSPAAELPHWNPLQRRHMANVEVPSQAEDEAPDDR